MLESGVAWNAEFMAPYVRAISPYTFLEFQCEEVRAVAIDRFGDTSCAQVSRFRFCREVLQSVKTHEQTSLCVGGVCLCSIKFMYADELSLLSYDSAASSDTHCPLATSLSQ